MTDMDPWRLTLNELADWGPPLKGTFNMQAQDIVAIDPGGVHVGVAAFRKTSDSDQGWLCWQVTEFTPEDFVSWFQTSVMGFDVVVVERFALYEDKAMSLIGSEMETSQLIGVIKYLAKLHGVTLADQPAAWQQPTLGLLRAYGIASESKRSGSGGHCLSAELHGWAYLVKHKLARGIVG